jgi:hypothetical protein
LDELGKFLNVINQLSAIIESFSFCFMVVLIYFCVILNDQSNSEKNFLVSPSFSDEIRLNFNGNGSQNKTSLTASLLVVDAVVLSWTNDFGLAQVFERNRLQRYPGMVQIS